VQQRLRVIERRLRVLFGIGHRIGADVVGAFANLEPGSPAVCSLSNHFRAYGANPLPQFCARPAARRAKRLRRDDATSRRFPSRISVNVF